MQLPLSLFVVLSLLVAVTVAGNSHGFNDNIDWQSYEEGLAKAKETNKPVMLLLHKSWCGACKRLKSGFADSKEIEDLSKHFVMINAEDDEAPHNDAAYQFDGGYIPRIFFLSSEGEIQKDITSGSPKYKYFHGDASAVVQVMKTALARLAGKQEL